MPGRYARSATATRVSEFLGTRSGRRFLREDAWEKGMPIVISQPHELLTDAMSLAATHNATSLVAFLDPGSNELLFLYISLPNKDLETVTPEPCNRTVLDFYGSASKTFARTFRVRGWKYSAIAHAISTCDMRTEVHDVLRGLKHSEALPRESAF